ncbi:hypothetical protein KY326_04715, partial [Candidatus Woesearchaeota archaeon]|nr:hypothetical protein [Candidatus Woesearchaeota archaeon]
SRNDVNGLMQLFWEQISFGEDHDFWQKMMRTRKIGFLNKVVYEYRIHPNQLSTPDEEKNKGESSKSDESQDQFKWEFRRNFDRDFKELVDLAVAADFHANMGEHDKATKLYYQILAINPEHQAALSYLESRRPKAEIKG